jgi:hypothetical protein
VGDAVVEVSEEVEVGVGVSDAVVVAAAVVVGPGGAATRVKEGDSEEVEYVLAPSPGEEANVQPKCRR